MDLFIINRYTGDTEENISTQESLHLEKLKQAIEDRKKAASQKVVSSEPIDSFHINENLEQNESLSEDTYMDIEQSQSIVLADEEITEKVEINIQKPKISNQFKVLGSSEFDKKPKVERVLPYWLSHAYSVSKNLQELTCKVEDQAWLHSTLKKTLAKEGVTYLFPVQEKVIPFILKEHSIPSPLWPHDICISAPTGSGKTLCFVLPIIQTLMQGLGHHIRALIVLPVQELAAQIAAVFRKYCRGTGLSVAFLSGATPWHKEQQQILKYTETHGWISTVDIVVCTAGRLVDHLQNTEGFSLKHLKFLVIDEADRIMDNIQNDWLYHMYKHIQVEEHTTNKIAQLNWDFISNTKSPPHKLLFSATLSPDPELLEQWGLFQPKLFSVAPISDNLNKNAKKYSTPDELKEQFVTCSTEEKPLILYHFLVEQKWDKVLCFTNSGQSAHRLTVLLNNWSNGEIKVAELSASIDRISRENVLKKFRLSVINVIISTDALARGIDIPDCNYVLSYDPPKNIKTYIHRVGRTARAGKLGNAVTILIPNQLQMFKGILKSGEKESISQIEWTPDLIEPLIDSYQRAIQVTKEYIQGETESKVKKSIELKRSANQKRKRKHNTNKISN